MSAIDAIVLCFQSTSVFPSWTFADSIPVFRRKRDTSVSGQPGTASPDPEQVTRRERIDVSFESPTPVQMTSTLLYSQPGNHEESPWRAISSRCEEGSHTMRTERGACELKSKEVGKVRKLGAAIADLSGNVLAGAVIDCSYKGAKTDLALPDLFF